MKSQIYQFDNINKRMRNCYLPWKDRKRRELWVAGFIERSRTWSKRSTMFYYYNNFLARGSLACNQHLLRPGGGTMSFISSLGIDSELFHGMGLWWPEHWTRWQPQACLWVVSSRLGLAEAVILLLPGLADGDFTVDLLISAFELLVDEPVTKTTWTFRHYLPTDTLCKDSILFSIPAGLHINYFPLFHVKNIPSNLRFKHLWQETDSKSLINTKAHCEAQNLIRWVTMVTLQFSCTHIMISTMFTCALLSARRPRTSCQRVKGSLLPFPRVHYPASV